MIMKKESYGFELIPKFKGRGGYPKQTIVPYKDEVKWNKRRAIQEAKFSMKGKMWTGANVKDAYTWKLKKLGL